MKGGKEWRASSTGPDWTDIAITLRELEKLHNVWISMRVLNAGLRHSNGLRIVCAAYTNVLVTAGDTGVVLVSREWPNPDNGSMEGTTYRLLHELDSKLSAEVWEQSPLPGT
jgi:hypothetical protein